MPAATYNLTIEQGADFAIQLTMSEDGSAKNLTGYSARAQMRQKKTDALEAATFTCTVTSALEGKVKMALANPITAALTPGIYFYDLELFTTSDTNVTRLLEGQAIVVAEVTR
jgi:hypothetical protein